MTPETTMRTGSQKGRKRVFHVFICTRDWKLSCNSGTSRSQRDIWRLQAAKEAQQSVDRRGDGLLPVPRHVWLRFQRPQWSTGRNFNIFYLFLALNQRTRNVTFFNISSSTSKLICSSIHHLRVSVWLQWHNVTKLWMPKQKEEKEVSLQPLFLAVMCTSMTWQLPFSRLSCIH